MSQGFIKLGELIEISQIEESSSAIPLLNQEILDSFKKTAQALKRVAPKAEDFLYFSAVMMHAAEAAALYDDGTPRLNGKGEPVKVGWDKSNGTLKWQSNDPSIKPYKNSNGDIFPEEELVKAYKKWAGKPLCVDHKSSSVEHVRGFIVDTYYDRALKRVVALCALDKSGYPQLARQVATGTSTNVSMGTAVGRAICTDCARVARTEADFCDHMRRKSCYGEINVDLNPIELSIVVNGADPKASIKHIIAAANTLNSYVETKQKELSKLAQQQSFSAEINFNDNKSDGENGATKFNINSQDLAKFKAELDQAYDRLSQLAEAAKNSQNNTNDMASEQDLETPSDDSGLTPPHERYASETVGEEMLADLRSAIKSIEAKLGKAQTSLNKLASTSRHTQEENMSGTNNMNKKGYFQGAGGVNEPTPGQVKYPKDPLNEQLREREDRHMVGQSPFPDVGAVDGLHPSPDSAEPSDELQRKKMLARAESEERAQRRSAIVNLAKSALENKTAYYQNGEGTNPGTPTPGKTKYPAEKLNEQLRDKEDKQMVGKKPFPAVGPVDGLYPEDLKKKQLLSRAGLSAKFVRAANEDGSRNLGKSAWQVYNNGNLLVSASVDELSGGNADLLHDKIATKDFGAKLLEKVKAQGADKVRALFKGAQAAPPADAAPPAEPAAPPANAGAPVEDTGGSGDPQESLLETAEKARDLVSDVVEGVRALTGEQAEMGALDDAAPAPAEMGATASYSTANLNHLRKQLNGTLASAMKECAANLNDHVQELEMVAGLYDKGAVNDSNRDFVGAIAQDALNETKTSIASGFKLMTAFVKYARGTQALVKRAEMEAELDALAESEGESMTDKDTNHGDDLMAMISDTNSDLDDVKSLMEGEESDLDESALDELLPPEEDDSNDLNAGDLKPETKLDPAMLTQAALSTLAGRSALRAKIAADALGKQDDGELQDMSHAKFSDMLGEADRHADGQTQLDVKPAGNLGKVETLPEVNQAMMDVAKAPPKVRKEAEAIHKLVSEGRLDVSDLDALVAEGADPAAVAYYKKYFGQADGGSEFASELVKEHVKAQLEAELNTYKLKIARAYELAYDMAERGMISADRSTVSDHVEQIMQYNDESFDSLKRIVARNPITGLQKQAGRLPQVGMIGSGDFTPSQPEGDMFEQLSAAFAKTTKRTF